MALIETPLTHRFWGLGSAWGPGGQQVFGEQHQTPGPLCPSVPLSVQTLSLASAEA